VDLWSEALTEPLTPAARVALIALGYAEADTDHVWSRLRALWVSRALRILTPPSRERIDLLLPRAIEVAGRFKPALATLGLLLDFIEAISGRGPYVSFFNEFPQALERVVRVLAASPWAARYLTRHPLLLDELIDSRAHEPTDCAELARSLKAELARASGDAERQMDILRESHHAHVFRLLTQDLAGRLTVEALSDHLAALADLIVDAALDVAWAQLSQRHREQPRFAVVAYGKLGGKELGYASDLDIIFLYDDDHERAGEIYARLAQRLITVLTTRTTAGTLFEIDLALRPDGSSGLLVSSLAAYRKYQNESAWVWEHQALTRTRFCAGDRDLGQAFEEVRRSVLSRPRDLEKLSAEIIAMRKKMQDAHPTKAGHFDLKHDPGGMIDIEFATQYLVLAYGHTHPQLLDDVGNIALLQRAGAAGLIDAACALQVADAYRSYRKRQHAIRLAESISDVSGAVEGKAARVDALEFVEERRSVQSLWQGLFDA
jgi:glutamate-ammonia-ligase adenylyltransferase